MPTTATDLAKRVAAAHRIVEMPVTRAQLEALRSHGDASHQDGDCRCKLGNVAVDRDQPLMLEVDASQAEAINVCALMAYGRVPLMHLDKPMLAKLASDARAAWSAIYEAATKPAKSALLLTHSVGAVASFG